MNVSFSQCYVVFVQEHGGKDLESFVLLNFDEARSLLIQVGSLPFFKRIFFFFIFILKVIKFIFFSHRYDCSLILYYRLPLHWL